MAMPDRVVTTDQLWGLNGPSSGGWVQVAPGLLGRADPVALHVLVPIGRSMDLCSGGEECPGPVIVAQLQLSVVDDVAPVLVHVLVPLSLYQMLPTTFSALQAAATLVPGVIEEVELLCSGQDSDADIDEPF